MLGIWVQVNGHTNEALVRTVSGTGRDGGRED